MVCFPFLFARSCVWLDLNSFHGLRRDLWRHTILGTEKLFQQDAFNIIEDVQDPELHLSIPETREACKVSKNSQVKYQTLLNYSPLLKLKFSLQMLRRVFHFATTHNKSCIKSTSLIPLNITSQCKLHYGVRVNLWCSEDLVNYSIASTQVVVWCWHSLSCIVSPQPLSPIVTFHFPPPVFHMFQQPGLHAFVYPMTIPFTELKNIHF